MFFTHQLIKKLIILDYSFFETIQFLFETFFNIMKKERDI